MSFGGFDQQQRPMADINVTPMVDVMLVLLVIFIIAAPLFTRALQLDLPTSSAAPVEDKTPPVVVSIDAAGDLYWQNDKVTHDEMVSKMADAAKAETPPVLQLKADKSTRYETIADVMSAAQESGLARIGFVTDPKPEEGKKK